MGGNGTQQLYLVRPQKPWSLQGTRALPPFFLIFLLSLALSSLFSSLPASLSAHGPTLPSSGSSLALALLYPLGASGQQPHSNPGQ